MLDATSAGPAHLDPDTGGPFVTLSEDGKFAFVELYSRFGKRRAVVDVGDVPIVERHLWHVARGKGGKPSPATTVPFKGRWLPMNMARVILRPARGFTVAHLNGSPLDCRRSNIEIRRAPRSRGGVQARRKREAAAQREAELAT